MEAELEPPGAARASRFSGRLMLGSVKPRYDRAVRALTEQRLKRLHRRAWVDAIVFAALATIAWVYVSGSIALVVAALGAFFIVTSLVLLRIASRRGGD